MDYQTAISNLLLLIILFCVNCKADNIVTNNAFESPPTIEYGVMGPAWTNITIGDRIIFAHETGDDFGLICKAPYPIKWNISGIIVPSDTVKFLPTKRNLVNETFEIAIDIFFLDAEGYSELISSADIICENVDNPTVQKKVSVFVKGTKPTLAARKSTVWDSNLIPCYTTDPLTVTDLLFIPPNGREQLVENVMYNPTEGFYSAEIFQGEFVCRKRSSEPIKITASVSSDKFSPESNSITVFSEETITFKCKSTTSPVKLRFIENENVTVSFVTQTDSLQEANVSSIFIESGSFDTIKGQAACILDDGSRNGRIIKGWNYEFIASPELYLDNFEGESQCISGYTPRILQTVRCKNPTDCQFMSSCFANLTNCNFKKQKQFYANTPTFCFIEHLGHGKGCASVPYSHYNGIAQCTVKDGLTKSWDYFVSLNLLKYSHWKDASLNELVRMDETPAILYTNKSSEFYCTAVAYLFANSLAFELQYKNGTRHILENNDDTVNASVLDHSDRRKIDEFNILGKVNIFLPIDAVAVYCNAPWINSTDVLVSTPRKFETRHLIFPTIESSQRESNEKFYTEEKNRRLTCFARGEPQPAYKWLYKDGNNGFKNALEVFPDLKTSVGSNGEGYLEFPNAGRKYSGEFKCIAVNSEGEIEKKYVLEVTDEPVSGKSVVYITTVLVILAVLLLVLGLLVVFMRRYKHAQELVRSLTDNEIDEFFQGKPELLSNGNSQSAEAIEFLPYKKEYEIPVNDIEFDQSDKNFLGSGEFSYVVKGMIISKSLPVAVKISKPTADVTLFKSLLSEVKIMIYIGGHEHVVTLIGVSTEGIRNRSIYIATEICDMGSLDKYVRKSRPTFIDLLDENQKIDKSLLPAEVIDGIDQVSTLDLINFAAQIAKGMEYLSFKSVVHADLATRNVLLTSHKVCKISDFGLSRKLYECNNYVKKTKSPLPWRWMAHESLNTLTFSSHSDVWSYGATLYEVFTLGDIPFPNEEWNKEFIARLANGMRMGRPRYSTPEIYSKIVLCWEHEPHHRPSFSTLRSFFEELLVHYGISPSADTATRMSTNPVSPTVSQPPPVRTDSGSESIYANYNDLPGLQVNHPRSTPSPTPFYMNMEEPGEAPLYVNQPEEPSLPSYSNEPEK